MDIFIFGERIETLGIDDLIFTVEDLKVGVVPILTLLDLLVPDLP